MTTERIDPSELPETLREPFAGRKVFGCLPPIFRECCGDEVTRWSLSLPFVKDEWIYATNGMVAARIKGTPLELALVKLASGDRFTPDPGKIFDESADYYRESFELPEGHTIYEVCPECQGTGYELFEIGEDDADDVCDYCDGLRVVAMLEAVEVVPGYFMAGHFIAMLRRFGGTAYAPVDLGADPAIPFKFTLPSGDRAVEGRIMPMSNDPHDAEMAPEESEVSR